VTEFDAAIDQEAPQLPPRRKPRRVGQWFLWLGGPVLAVAGVAWYVFTSGRFATTDNAYVRANVITIASEVAGRVVEVAVDENQRVQAGDLLYRIDPEPFELAVTELHAMADAVAQYLDSSRDGYDAALADLDSKNADLKHALQLFQRIEDLRAKGVASQESLDDATNEVETTRADRDAAIASVAKAKTLLGGDPQTPLQDLPGYKVIMARLTKAQLDLSHTVVRAPADGVIGRKKLEAGDFLNVGQPAMPLVTDDIWLEANFKETDMTWVRPGQTAVFSVDAYPGPEWQAEVASISPASSAIFSVLPAENATGNWVKVVQRIPVRLRIINPRASDVNLRAGMSAEVKIDTGRGHTLTDRWFGAESRADRNWAGNGGRRR